MPTDNPVNEGRPGHRRGETFFSRVSRAEAEYGLPVGLASIGRLALAGVGGLSPALVAAGGGQRSAQCLAA
jgi:hypothetical protein